ncbi:MAG: stage II sporulation protein M [Candidatus Nanoarchaeia archaeon]
MVLEQIFDIELSRKKPFFAFLYGILFTFVGFFVALMFFKGSLSLTTIFLITLLLVPTLTHLLSLEERRERREGMKHFLKNHKDVVEVYLFAFLGVFVGYILLGLLLGAHPSYDLVFKFQNGFLQGQEGLTADLLFGFFQKIPEPSAAQLMSIISNNMAFVIVCFIFSLFYGASAIFLLILNASVFANFILFLLKNISGNLLSAVKIFFFFLIHLIPEVIGFLLAAIAGGVLSKALMSEKRGTDAYRNVVKDATLLLLMAFALIVVGALLEVYVTTNLFFYFL